MQVQQFNEIPELLDLMPHGGRPGFEYAIIACFNVVRAQKEGWSSIYGVQAFEITGPSGACPSMLVGRGMSIYGTSPGTMVPISWLDRSVSEQTGLWLPDELPPQVVTAAEVTKPKAAAAGAAQMIIESQKPAPAS